MKIMLLISMVVLLAACSGGESSPISEEVAAAVACEIFAKRELLGASGLTFADSDRASVTKTQLGRWIAQIYAERKDGGGRLLFTCVMTKRGDGSWLLDAFHRRW